MTGGHVLRMETGTGNCISQHLLFLTKKLACNKINETTRNESTTYDLGASVTLVTTPGVHVFCPGFLTRTVSPVFRGFRTFAFRL